MTIDATHIGDLCALQAQLDNANETIGKHRAAADAYLEELARVSARELCLQSAVTNAAHELNAANTAADVAEQKQLAAEAECERLRDQLMSTQKVHHDLFVAHEGLGLERDKWKDYYSRESKRFIEVATAKYELRDELTKAQQQLEEVAALGSEPRALLAEMAAVREDNRRLRREVTLQIANNRERNLALDALHYVWCSGGCVSGAHRYTDAPVTAELVGEAVRNTGRLVSWYINNAGKSAPPGEDRAPHWQAARDAVDKAVGAATIRRLNRLRAQMLVWKLTQRIATCHSGNCKRPLLRRQIALQRIARVERLASQ